MCLESQSVRRQNKTPGQKGEPGVCSLARLR
nr:MAG TPA: hypothetical protein [Caudoviricetes sp.]